MYIIIIIITAISLLFFEKPLPKHHAKQHYMRQPDTFVIDKRRATAIRRYFTGTVCRWHIYIIYSNTANLGVCRSQETALPTDRVVFIL